MKAPKGWWWTEGGGLDKLEDPERTLSAWLVETREADGAIAIAQAWERVSPGRRLQAEVDARPPTDGWDAITTASYEGDEGRQIEAIARRLGPLTYVVLVDGDRAAMARRGAQIEQWRRSLRPAGLHDESFAHAIPRPIDALRASALDAFVADALTRLEVPGAAIAVVHGDHVIYERSFGVRELGKPEPVTPDTLFLVASITKSMTTMMQATLVDAGLVTWDTPVVSVLPSFALGDAALTRKIVLWHMSCACTGMPRNDLEHIFQYDGVTPEERVASMRTMLPTTGLGEAFQYSNLMVAAGGFIAGHAFAPRASLGDAYDRAMSEKLFRPIGMASTTFDFDAVRRREHAVPHAPGIDGKVRPMSLDAERNVISIRPAGGAWSSLHDMERYVMTEIAEGVAPDKKRVVGRETLLARRKLRIGDPVSGGYGLGLDVGQYHDLAVVEHDGGAFGFGTSMFVLPEPRIGIVVLTNVRNDAPTEHLPFNAVVKRRVIEALFEEARPLARAELDDHVRGKARALARRAGSLPSPIDAARLKELLGSYENERLGTITLTSGPNGALLDAGEWKGAVGQRLAPDGAVTLIFLDPPFPGAEYVVGGDATHPTLTVDAGQTKYVFVRRDGHPRAVGTPAR
jgi:CubicO group peptidase (beta-lactamase class C family)